MSQDTPTSPNAAFADRLTLAAIGAAAYMTGTLLHEGVGHGGACLISGGTPIVISTVHMECSADNRLVMAGGTLTNLAAAVMFWVLGRVVRRPTLRYFCWLSMTINLMSAAGYFLFSGIGGFGDWAAFITGLGPEWLLRVLLTIVGALSYAAVVRFSLLEMRPLIGSQPELRIAHAARLIRMPYFTGGTLNCIAGALNPAGMYLVALSAAASTFGGTSAFLWMDNWLRSTRSLPLGSYPEPTRIQRNWTWIVASSLAAIAFVLVVGRGIRFH